MRRISNNMLKTVVLGVFIISIDAVQYEHQYQEYVQPVQVEVPVYQENHQQEPHYDKPDPYSFGYDLKDGHGNIQFQREEGDQHGTKRGSYGYTDAYGIYRHVEYIADALGFRAIIKTNEPGTANQNPSHVEMHVENPPNYNTGPENHNANNYNHISYSEQPVYEVHQE